MGICFPVSRRRCISNPTPNAHLAHAPDQKAPAGLGQLVSKPLPLISAVSVCMRAGRREHVGCMDVTETGGEHVLEPAFVAVFIFVLDCK